MHSHQNQTESVSQQSSLETLLARAQTYSAFADHERHLCTGADLKEVVAAAQRAMADGAAAAVSIFYDATGERTEVEPHGSVDGVRSRLEPPSDAQKRTGPGRPKLGVVSREVSLLPRHWDWLGTQPGGASAALRRLIDEARKLGHGKDAARRSVEAAAKAMTVLCGDKQHFEEALRALYRGEFSRIATLTTGWPRDLSAHVLRLVDNAAELSKFAQREGQQATEN